eukprot:scpid106322/ scgid0201/ Charged multivesicular body protein 5; Chromatin-modifying protein 5; SNF7 domain-containing protein 2 &gt; Charged multivesicular body protein 5; Chromatin-modifying protein 5
MKEKIKKVDAELVKCKRQINKMRDGPAKEKVKQRALQLLNLKRRYETHHSHLEKHSWNMERANFQLQNMKNVHTTAQAMRVGVKELKKQYQKINVDEIENLQDDMEEMREKADEIQELVGRSYGVPDGLDEDDLDAELQIIADEYDSGPQEPCRDVEGWNAGSSACCMFPCPVLNF